MVRKIALRLGITMIMKRKPWKDTDQGSHNFGEAFRIKEMFAKKQYFILGWMSYIKPNLNQNFKTQTQN